MKNMIISFVIILTNLIRAGNFSDKHVLSLSIDSLKTYSTKEIIVQDKLDLFEKISSNYTEKIKLTDQITSLSIGNLIASKPGIFTKSYGSEGSLQTISVRGTGSEYTSVYINGVNYSGSLNGVFDFSKFSSEDVSEIVIKKGNDFEPLNNNSFGGVIELNPFEKHDTLYSLLKLQIGSFGYQAVQLKNSGNIFNTYYKINLVHKSAKNNYKYSFNNEFGIRKNADLFQNSLTAAFINHLRLFNRTIKINSFLNYLDKEIGLPGFVSSNRHLDNKTREQEKLFSYSLNSKILLSNHLFINGILGIQQNLIQIEDPLKSINLSTNYFELENNSLNAKLFLHLVQGKLSLAGGISTIMENLKRFEKKENMLPQDENLKRESHNLNFNVNFWSKFKKNFRFNSSFLVSFNRVQNYFQKGNTFYNFTNLRFGSSVSYDPLNLNFYGNIGRGTRIPNYYEYAFSKLTSLNNKELVPENIVNYELGISYINERFNLDLTYFTFDVGNKIIWRPQRVAIFSPANFGRVRSSGIELNIEEIKIIRSFSAGVNYTFARTRKKSALSPEDNTFNKQLPYIPEHKASILLNLHSNSIDINFTGNYFSRRFITEDNDILFSLDPVFISDLKLTYSTQLNAFNIRFQIAIQNLFNTSYLLIQSFPMPGREYRLTIQMEV